MRTRRNKERIDTPSDLSKFLGNPLLKLGSLHNRRQIHKAV